MAEDPHHRLRFLEEENQLLREKLRGLEQEAPLRAYQLIREIIDSSEDLIAALDADFRYVAFNQAYRRETKRVFGVDIDIGVCMVEALAGLPEDQKKATEIWGKALRGESFTIIEEFRGIGEPRFFEGFWHPLRDAGGKIFGAAHIVREVTDRIMTERALRTSEEEFRAFFDNAAVGTSQLNLEGRYLRVNDRLCQLTGYSREELLRMTPFEITHPEDRQRDRDGFQALLRGEIPRYVAEKRYLRKDGGILWGQVTAGLVRDTEGHPLRTVAITQDISDRKKAEFQLRTLAAVVEKSGDFIGLASPELEPTYLNEAGRRMVGLETLEEVRNSEILEYVWPEDRPFAKAQALPTLLREGRWSSEIRLRHFRTGEPIWVAWNIFEILDAEGKRIALATVSPDITRYKVLEKDLKQAKEAAEDANQAKSEFLAGMSHEIRTPMTVFMAAVEYLRQIDPDPVHREFLDMAENAAQRLRELIEDILDFSKIEARRVEIHTEPFELQACVKSAVGMFTLAAEEKGLRLETELAPDLPGIVLGDAARLGQVLVNLVGNAVKFTETGEVRVSVTAGEGTLHFSVSDTGIGIPEEKRPLLFGRFIQLESFRTRTYAGTGLGLAICKGLMELMGGRIGMQPREGGGSIFSFSLPLFRVETEGEWSPTGSHPERTARAPKGLRVLLVEDDPMARKAIRKLLDRQEWCTDTAASGPEAIARCRQQSFDVILMDIQLPGMTGLEAAKAIRSLEEQGARRIPIIGLTAHARHELREECLAAGMDEFLAKPLRMRDLVAAVEHCLERSGPSTA